jgi:hypothetical protein
MQVCCQYGILRTCWRLGSAEQQADRASARADGRSELRVQASLEPAWTCTLSRPETRKILDIRCSQARELASESNDRKIRYDRVSV